MSGLYENQKTIRLLRSQIANIKSAVKLPNIYFVLGYPRSDIGKGTLVAQLLNILPDSDAIKFDGLLNTNENGRHTAEGHDDFGIYEKFNNSRKWGRDHYLLGGELYHEFITKFGENENLQINPHMSYFVEYKIWELWKNAGMPKHFIIEVGGLVSDPEVEPIFTPIIQRLSEENLARTILLTELSWNGDYIKTKTVQDAMRALVSRRITPWLLAVRDSSDIPNVDNNERLEFERIIFSKIYNNFNIKLSRIISIPFFIDLLQYTTYMSDRFLPLVNEPSKTEILVATSNFSKYKDFSLYLGNKYKVLSLNNLDINIDIPEGIESIEDNAIAKARAYAIRSGRISIGDDTGFFIKALNGEPGVALRRWGGELPENTSNKDFWKYLQDKTKNLENLNCYFKQCIAIVSPTGKIATIYNITEGYLNREKLKHPYNGTGYPIGAAFEANNRDKTWDEMTDSEKRTFDADFIDNLNSALSKIIIPNVQS